LANFVHANDRKLDASVGIKKDRHHSMPITHTSRNGKTYNLHTGPKRCGGTQHYFSTKPTGTLAQRLPEGFEVYETVNAQVYLRRQQPKTDPR
jgi:hypothetical protein